METLDSILSEKQRLCNLYGQYIGFGGGTVSSVAGYEVSYSCRFNSDNSAYTTFTPSAGNTKKWTVSVWFKRGDLGRQQVIWSAGSWATNYSALVFESNDRLKFEDYTSSAFSLRLETNRVFRDPHGWYHVVVKYDSTPSTPGSSHCAMYVNGVQETSFAIETYPSQDEVTTWNSNVAHQIGYVVTPGTKYFDGYASEFVHIEDDNLAATSFGETDDNGVWRPIDVSGLTYNTNAFYLNFAVAPDTVNGAGTDASTNTNHFTDSASLTSSDRVPDSPTNNYCVMSSIDLMSGATLANGNLDSSLDANNCFTFGTMPIPATGKWYFEVDIGTRSGGQGYTNVGIMKRNDPANTHALLVSSGANPAGLGVSFAASSGNKLVDGTASSYGSAPAQDSVIGVAINADEGAIWFSDDGTWQNSATIAEVNAGTDTNAADKVRDYGANDYVPVHWETVIGGHPWVFNFGQHAFQNTQPTGYLALNTTNIPVPTIVDPSAHYQAVIYDGNTSGQTVSQNSVVASSGNNSTFKPDIALIKCRDGPGNGANMYDECRGDTQGLNVSDDGTEDTESDITTLFGTTGGGSLTFTGGGSSGDINTTGRTYVAYMWKAGGAPTATNSAGAGATPTAGSVKIDGANLGSALAGTIPATKLSASTTAGISVGTYTGTGSAGTVAHGLGAIPKMVIVKERADDTGAWFVYNSELATDAATDYLLWDTSGTVQDDATVWNDVAPTSTVFSIGTHVDVNDSAGTPDTYVYYAFAEISGLSKFGSYTGNGNADGDLVITGFKPALTIFRRFDAGNQWIVFDRARDLINPVDARWPVDEATTEASGIDIDYLSNGFKLRNNSAIFNGGSGVTTAKYIYMAWAENPFGGHGGKFGGGVSPATAR